jgi:hypothetical protein
MAIKVTSALMLLCLFLNILGCSGSVKETEPKSPDEEAIVALLTESQQTWSNGDTKGWLALWHEDGKIMYGRERTILTKREYEKIISERMAANPTYQFGKPKISISGNEATVKTSMALSGRSTPVTLNLLKQNNQWLFTSWTY